MFTEWCQIRGRLADINFWMDSEIYIRYAQAVEDSGASATELLLAEAHRIARTYLGHKGCNVPLQMQRDVNSALERHSTGTAQDEDLSDLFVEAQQHVFEELNGPIYQVCDGAMPNCEFHF